MTVEWPVDGICFYKFVNQFNLLDAHTNTYI